MSEALSLNDFAAQLSQASEPAGQAQAAPETDAGDEPLVEEATTEAIEPESEPSQEGAEQEEADSEDGQAPAAPDEEMVIKWTTAAGETHEAPLKELKDGYMRQSDYTQKAQQLSQEREKVQTAVFQQYKIASAIGPELGQLQLLQSQIAQYQQINWNQLKAEAPERYNTLATEYMVLREQHKESEASIVRAKDHLESMRKQSALEADAEAAKGFDGATLQKMDAYLTKAGIAGDARIELIATLGKGRATAIYEAIHKAIQWDALQSKKPEIENRAKAIPPKPVAKAAAPKQVSQLEAVAKAAQSNKPMSRQSFAEMLAQTRKR